MAEFPALPLFTDALVADTAHLTDEEFGAYMRLLILEWRTAGCKLPADAAWHMRRLGLNSDKYNQLHAPLISEFFVTDGNHVFQKRLIKEFTYLREQSQKQSARAKQRWEKEKKPCRSDAASGNAPHPTPPIKQKKDKPSSATPNPLPDWLPIDTWNAYLEVRQKLRAPNTANAIRLLLCKLTALRSAGHDPQHIIEQSIERGWRSFFQPKGDSYENPRRQFAPGPTKDERARSAVMRAAERLGFAPQPEPREPAETRNPSVP